MRLVPPGAVRALVLALVGSVAAAQIPPGYYDSVNESSAATLRATLHPVIDDHQRIPYTSGGVDTWIVLELADEDPSNATRILDVYRNASYAKQGAGNSFYQREHSWPNSFGFPDDVVSNYPYTDCHHLFLCDGSYNSARSNKPFRQCDAACVEWDTLANGGQGGGSGVYPGNGNWTSGSFSEGMWEVWSGRRGDVARAMFYMDVRYEGGSHGLSGASEPDLRLTDDEALIDLSNTGSNESTAYMGLLSVLLQWHYEDPVDVRERDRNDVVHTFQGNRNPFVDHPEWVDVLWAPANGGTPPTTPWINEIHYDNNGSDTGELVEVAGRAGTNLAGWTLVGYNGNGGSSYATIPLSGVLPDQGSCIGAIAFPFVGLQNGSPDGIALVDPANNVVEFLSYEGAFVAANGFAAGMQSVDIVVEESFATDVGLSLQLGGIGGSPADFSWQSPQWATPGAINAGQVLRPGSLAGCPGTISIGSGGTHQLYLTAGATHASQLYLVLGSASGTSPGFLVDGTLLPLNFDPYMTFTLQAANSPTYVNTLGVLGAPAGAAMATINVPTGLNPNAVGLAVDHAYLTLSPGLDVELASIPARFTFAP